MKIINDNNRLTIKDISKEELDISKTFDCGQTFRWKQHKNGFWYGVVNNRIVAVKQVDNVIYTNLSIQDAEWFKSYLDLDTDYIKVFEELNLDKQDYAYKAYEYSKGIHILRQDLFETIITFVISQMNSMCNIRSCVNRISEMFGESLEYKMDNNEQTVLYGYKFPSAKDLGNASMCDLRKCSLGFRAEYIHNISKYIADHPEYIENLKKASYKDSMTMLKQFKGIGDKVANCICLFSLHHVNAFPIDTHMKQIINKYYNGSLDLSKFGDVAGIVQQYMFYYKAFTN